MSAAVVAGGIRLQSYRCYDLRQFLLVMVSKRYIHQLQGEEDGSAKGEKSTYIFGQLGFCRGFQKKESQT